jgi:antirestriction protein ArdC
LVTTMITSSTQIDKATAIADCALGTLADQLAAGQSAALTDYLRTMAKFHSYSMGNVMLIYFQRPDATRVAGFETWKTLGRHVRRGEKGIIVRIPTPVKVNKDTDKEEPLMRFKCGHVFDVSQTEGEQLPEFTVVRGDPGCLLNRLECFASDKGIRIERHENLGNGVKGVSHKGSVSLRKFLEPAEEFAVLAHELAHELMHQGLFPRPDRHVLELEAEAVSFVVCSAAGLDVGTASSDYIQLYTNDLKQLAASLDRIKRCSGEMIEQLQ